MEIAATIKLPLSVPNRLSLAAVRPFRSPSSPSFIHQRLLRPNTTAPMKLSTRLSAANETMANPISPTDGFLGRTSEGFVPFCKFQGLGNDFIMIDNRKSPELRISRERAVQLCDRNFGIGADGVIFALPPDYTSEYGMRIYNSDGSEPEMCGNGIRCLAKFLAQLESLERNQSYKIRTGAGIIITELQPDGRVRVNMGQPILEASAVPTNLPANKDDSVVKAELEVDGVTWNVTCVSMGNPHCVTFGTKGGEGLQVDELNLAEIGPKFEIHDAFPARTNTEFVQVLSRTHLKMRVWERGAGATLACGTGACAVVVAAVLEGIAERSCTVDLPGGPLMIEWNEKNNRVYMTGPAEPVFFGQFPLEI